MIGIMQGRLVPPEGGRFQSFPRERWVDEFQLAASVPLQYIEWVFDDYGFDINPISNDDGVETLKRKSSASGVLVRSVCADYFMDSPLLRCSETDLSKRLQILRKLIRNAHSVGANRIVLPFVDASRIETVDDTDRVVAALKLVLSDAEQHGLELHLETSLPPDAFAVLLERLPHPLVKVNYDSGNSSSLGFRVPEEFNAYGPRIGSVHIKDRLLGGGTVPLGTGDTDFAAVFSGLRELAYRGDFTLQVARGEPGNEVDLARRSLDFISRQWSM